LTLAEAIVAYVEQLIAQSKIKSADTSGLTGALTDLQTLLPVKETAMTVPTPNVQIPQADLDKFAAEFKAVFTALKTYITMLVANQATPLSAADETGLAAALAAGEALEPPSA
jgi:hypothetical protein